MAERLGVWLALLGVAEESMLRLPVLAMEQRRRADAVGQGERSEAFVTAASLCRLSMECSTCRALVQA